MTQPQSPGPDPKALRELLAKAVENADEKSGSGITGGEFNAWWNRRLDAREAVFAALPGLLDRLEELEARTRAQGAVVAAVRAYVSKGRRQPIYLRDALGDYNRALLQGSH